MKSQPLRVWMAAVIAAPAIVLAGAGIAAAQSSPAAPVPAASAPSAPAATDGVGNGRHEGRHHGRHEHGKAGHPHHRGHGPHPGMGMMGARPDADGNVSRADVLKAQQRQLALFDKIDANSDGLLSKDERAAFHRQMREAREKHKAERDAPPAPTPAPATPQG